MIKLDKEYSEEIARENYVTIEDLLNGIYVFHECQESFGFAGHCYLRLFEDGSGTVATEHGDTEIVSFPNLKEFVKYTKSLCEKHGIVWEKSKINNSVKLEID